MPRPLLVTLAAAVLGCGATTATPQPNPAIWTVPPDWVTVASADGAVHLTLPPWLEVFDNQGAIFANEPPPAPGAEFPMELMVVGPRLDDPPGPGQTIVAWVDARLATRGQGVPRLTHVVLPSGRALRYERIDRLGTPQAWRILAFAIEVPGGLVYLQLDGPPDSWAARAEALERIPFLLRISTPA